MKQTNETNQTRFNFDDFSAKLLLANAIVGLAIALLLFTLLK